MQSLSAFFEDNKPLAFAIMFAALLVLIIVLFLLYRLVFGRRLKASAGGRARQPRLGIVDAFDLDRQRQLVLVRRDNVEHLIMIGGPNDVVLESSIVRTQSVASMSPGRDKDAALPTAGPLPQIPAATPLSVPPLPVGPATPPPAGPIPAPVRSSASVSASSSASVAAPPPPAPAPTPDRVIIRPKSVEEAQAAAEEPVATSPPPLIRTAAPSPAPRPAAAAAGPSPLPPRNPPSPLPPRPSLTPRPASSLPPRPPLPPRSPATLLPPRPTTPLPVRPDQPPAAQGAARTTPPTLGGVTPGNTGITSDNAPQIGIAGGDRPALRPGSENQQPSRAGGPVGPAPRVEAEPPKGFETLESLEEEMAKLLGRTTPRREG